MPLLKKSFLIILLLSLSFNLQAQKKSIVDQGKLLDYYNEQQFAEAVQYLQSFYTEDNKDPKLLSQLGYSYLMNGELVNAEGIYLKLYSLQPKNTVVQYQLASLNLKRGNFEKARTYFTGILAIDSTNFNTIKQLALLEKKGLSEQIGSTSQSLKYLKQANHLNPFDGDIAFQLSEGYLKADSLDKAAEILAPALKADSANLQLLKMKLPLELAQKKYQEAIQTGLKLLSCGDSSAFTLNHIGKAYFALLDYSHAISYFLKIKGNDVENEPLFYSIALCYKGLKEAKSAAKYFEKTITEGVSSKTASYYGLLGEAYEANRQNEEALAAYKRGLLFENNGSLYYNIALLYENKLNDRKNAITYYNLYLKNFRDMDKSPKLAAFIKSKIEDLKR